MKKIVLLSIPLIVVLITWLILNNENRVFNGEKNLFDANKIVKIDPHILDESFSDRESISTLINALNSSKQIDKPSNKFASYLDINLTLYDKIGEQNEVRLLITYGKEGELIVNDRYTSSQKVYLIPMDQVNKIYEVLQFL